MKKCGGCKLHKDYVEFYSNISSPDGYSWSCKRCTSKYAKNARIGAYGITKDQFNYLLEQQDGRCAICQVIFTEEILAAVDHDHACCPKRSPSNGFVKRCGRCVRGLLCTSCNAGLGMFKDDVQRLISAAKYLDTRFYLEYEVEEISLDNLKIAINVIE